MLVTKRRYVSVGLAVLLFGLLVIPLYHFAENKIPAFLIPSFYALAFFATVNYQKGQREVSTAKVARGLIIISISALIIYGSTLTVLPKIEQSIGINPEWKSLALIHWTYLFSYLLLTSFFPGFFILSIFKTSFFSRLVLSVPVSIFTIGLLSLTNLAGLRPYFPLFLLELNVLVLGIFIARRFVGKGSQVREQVIQFDANKVLFLSSFLLFTFFLITLPVFDGPELIYDMPKHFMISSEDILQDDWTRIKTPWLFNSFAGFVLSSTPIPGPIVFNGFFVFNLMVPLSFFAMVGAFFRRDARIPMISTLLCFSSGFAGIIALFSLLQGGDRLGVFNTFINLASKTYGISPDVMINFQPSFVLPMYAVGIPSYFLLLYLIKTQEVNGFLRGGLLLSIATLAYLGHFAEGLIFSLVFLLLVIFKCVDARWSIVIPLAIAPMLAITIGIFTPSDLFIPSFLELQLNFGNMLIASTILFLLAGFINMLRWNVNPSIFIDKRLLYVLPCAYVILILFYLLNYEQTNSLSYVQFAPDYIQIYGSFFVPFYVEPIRWGVIGILLVIYFVFCFKQTLNDESTRAMLVMVVFGLVSTQLMTGFPLYPAQRMDLFALAGALPLASMFLLSLNRCALRYMLYFIFVLIGSYSFVFHAIYVDLFVG